MAEFIRDRYVIFSIASICAVVLVCAVGAFNHEGIEGNGINELEGVISEPSATQNGTVFKLTDLGGNEYRCFYSSKMPAMPALCRLIGSFSSDGNMFFVDRIITDGKW
jgi:hypothetical protein